MMKHLIAGYASSTASDVSNLRDMMMEHLLSGDAAALERSLREMFARIPLKLHIPQEAYYHSLFLLWLNLLGFDVIGEMMTDKGIIDAVWTCEERVVVAEIKYSKKEGDCEKLLINAFKQIKDNRYYERYSGSGKGVALLAIAFAGKEITCKFEEYE